MVERQQHTESANEHGNQLSSLLEKRLEENRSKLRPNQIQTIEKLINALQRGVFQGLIKQPTGAGKTRLFGEILHALHLPSLVLVPRSNLIQQTKGELAEVGYTEEEIISIEPKSNRGATPQIKNAIKRISESANGHVIVMTYQSFLSVAKKKEILEQLLTQVKVVISDEAHRSLGEQTKERLREIDESVTTQTKNTRKKILKNLKIDEEHDSEEMETELSDEERAEIQEILEEEDEEQQIESVTMRHQGIPHLRLTATPRLAEKEVQEVFGIEVIDWVRIQELVEDGTLILPQLIETGIATYALDSDETKDISDSFLSQAAEEDRFRMEDGRSVFEANTEKYLELREQCGGSLPAVVFCGTVPQAQKYLEYVRSVGISAVRVTSASGEYDKGMSVKESKKLMEDGTIDMVVTVSKVGEGWDVPTLRCAIWNVPTRSPARCLQGNGRIMRCVQGKTRENTFIIDPVWLIVRKEKKKKKESETEKGDQNIEGKRAIKQTYQSVNFYERLFDLEEVDVETLQKIGMSVEKRERVDVNNDNHLRLLIGSVHSLIKDGKGVCLIKQRYTCAEKKWEVSGGQIGHARWGKRFPGSSEAESLARTLWPEEVKSLLPEERIDLMNDDHLRLLIGSVKELIKDGKGVYFTNQRFTCAEKKWEVSGRQIGNARWGNNSPGSSEAESLARTLWPEEVESLLPRENIDLMNDDHLRLLIGSVKELIKDGKGVSLGRQRYTCSEKKWEVSGGQIGYARWGNYSPRSSEAELLARTLWPEEAESLLPRESIDLMNDDHLRLLIGSVKELIKDGKGVCLIKQRYTCAEKKWEVSGYQIGNARWGNYSPGSSEAESLARTLWPEEAERLLGKKD